MNFIAKPKVPTREIRMNVLTAYNNKINVNNEGVKHGGYARVLARRKANNIFSDKCKSLISNCSVLKKILSISSPIAICAYNNFLYIASSTAEFTIIGRLNLLTNEFIPNWFQQEGNFSLFDLVANGNYLYTGIENQIIRINITTGVSEIWIPDTEGLAYISGLTIYNNDLYVININIVIGEYTSKISKINLTTGSVLLDWYTSSTHFMVSMREYNNMLYIINYDANTITKYDLLTDEVIEDWIPVSAGLLAPISLTIHNNIMYVSNFVSISKINIITKQVQNNWVVIPTLYYMEVPFIMLTNYTVDGNTKLYVSAFINGSVYSILIDTV